MKKEAILFGASNMGKAIYSLLKDTYSIIAFCDNDASKQGNKYCGIDVLTPSQLRDYPNAAIIITSNYYSEIKTQLEKLKIKNYKTFTFSLEDEFIMHNSLKNIAEKDIFKKFNCWEGELPSNFLTDFLGIKTRRYFWKDFGGNDNSHQYVKTSYPPVDENYFEWIDLLESVITSKDKFIMIELGAGWGRWLVRGAFAAKRYHNIPFFLIGVEAEPAHYKMMQEHFQDNDIPINQYNLIEAAVAEEDGKVNFTVGDAQNNYGQTIADKVFNDNMTVKEVPALSLSSLLKKYESIDLIDIDIQGFEYKVITACDRELLNQKVKKIHIGTHNRTIEIGLRLYFSGLGWENIFDFPCQSSVNTDLGRIIFQDGVQSWKNPNFK